MQVPRRLSPAEMADLSRQHGVEFSLTYRVGPGRAGGGGTYWLHSGSQRRVSVPLGEDVRWIYHTHPGGTRWASNPDLEVLDQLRRFGSPQRSSQIVLPNGETSRFGGSWTRSGAFAP